MKERLPKIVDLKAKGLIGENNKGYLECLKGKKDGKAIVDAENADRKKVYAHIAKKQGTTIEVVGKLRAKKIAEKAKAGQWIQGADGKWGQKKK